MNRPGSEAAGRHAVRLNGAASRPETRQRRRDPGEEPEAGSGTRGHAGTPEARPDTARADRFRIRADPETVERDLTRLVLTLVELLRQLVERQAVRRMDQDDLSDDQIETLGLTLMRLEEAMTELCERFGLSPSDLNLDLGPLGTLLPTD
ncbi:gas vesicle protein K [Sphaerisporangium sp. TRM90804]|uniref:gas vesicle protein K n=1 Tax=Sphaerisporangium sp. TRM90804 TaxID=3031113 RepID=UPI00244B292A|nr:gas vesicle protein K [Sphaerisporangium sp. TRM90804]MDH2430165.1 gas vesicle protein K [Sphaerisporangium sp. TRM90804]